MLGLIGKAAGWTGKIVAKDILLPILVTALVGMAMKAIVARLPPAPANRPMDQQALPLMD